MPEGGKPLVRLNLALQGGGSHTLEVAVTVAPLDA